MRKVTHIATPDANGKIIGRNVQQEGVIFEYFRLLRVCTSVTYARYTVTTEAYPDSPRTTDAECNNAQVESVVGALDFIIKNMHNEYGYDLPERKKQDGIQDLVSFLDYGYSNR